VTPDWVLSKYPDKINIGISEYDPLRDDAYRLANRLWKNRREVEIFYCRYMAHDPIMSYTKDLKLALPEHNIYNDIVIREFEKWIRQQRLKEMKRLKELEDRRMSIALERETVRRITRQQTRVEWVSRIRSHSAPELSHHDESCERKFVNARVRFYSSDHIVKDGGGKLTPGQSAEPLIK